MSAEGPQIMRFAPSHLAGVMRLFAAENWTYGLNEERTGRALTSAGSMTLVAVQNDEVIGVAQTLSDGEIQGFLSVLLVAEQHRARGIGRALLQKAICLTPGVRLDLMSAADGFYEALGFERLSGFRVSRGDGSGTGVEVSSSA